MKLELSYLSIIDKLKEKINVIDNLDIDFIHVDVMDGLFVNNKTIDTIDVLKNTKKPKDVHLMVKDVIKYVDLYSTINPEYITFHIEVGNTLEYINYIKSKNIKVGIAINPETDIEKINNYLNLIDQVLIMSVTPGKGGQSFIKESLNKIDYLNNLKNKNKYIINIDGGINYTNIKLLNTDIAVIGSYITMSNDYEKQIKTLRN